MTETGFCKIKFPIFERIVNSKNIKSSYSFEHAHFQAKFYLILYSEGRNSTTMFNLAIFCINSQYYSPSVNGYWATRHASVKRIALRKFLLDFSAILSASSNGNWQFSFLAIFCNTPMISSSVGAGILTRRHRDCMAGIT